MKHQKMKHQKIIIMIIASRCLMLILLLTIGMVHNVTQKKTKRLVFSDTIKSIEVTNGTNGTKILIDQAKDLEKVQAIINGMEFTANSKSEDTTGYQWRILIRGERHQLEIMGEKLVTYDKGEVVFSKQEDYQKLAECIGDMFQTYAMG